MSLTKPSEVDKINVEELIQVFKDINHDAFILYVKSVWKVSLNIKNYNYLFLLLLLQIIGLSTTIREER